MVDLVVAVALEDSKASDRGKDSKVNNKEEISLRSLKSSLEAAKVVDQEVAEVHKAVKHKGERIFSFKLR